jgi:hypothetical protein
MQESPIVQEFVTMDLCPRVDETLLRAWRELPIHSIGSKANTASDSWYAA